MIGPQSAVVYASTRVEYEYAVPDVRFDEIENVLASLDLLATVAPLVKNRRYRSLWKWMIIAAHDAVQGAIVCAIADTTRTSILREKSAGKMLEFLEGTSKEYPGEYMADFKTLMNRANIDLPPQDAKDIRMLHDLRNDFVHFTPKGWSIELGRLPRVTGPRQHQSCKDCIGHKRHAALSDPVLNPARNA